MWHYNDAVSKEFALDLVADMRALAALGCQHHLLVAFRISRAVFLGAGVVAMMAGNAFLIERGLAVLWHQGVAAGAA